MYWFALRFLAGIPKVDAGQKVVRDDFLCYLKRLVD